MDPTIAAYYARSPEEDRHTRGLSQLEAYRTRQLIERHAPPAPATVLDVGGAAGAYAFWLAERGYTVHLLDPVPRLIDQAKARADSAGRPLASCEVGDARALPYADGSAQVVLLLGPLYHLVDPADRARALAEASRVLAPGGLLFTAAITRWAYALYGLMRDLLADPAFRQIVDASVRWGAPASAGWILHERLLSPSRRARSRAAGGGIRRRRLLWPGGAVRHAPGLRRALERSGAQGGDDPGCGDGGVRAILARHEPPHPRRRPAAVIRCFRHPA